VQWKRVIFSDESNYHLVNRKTTPYIWALIDQKTSGIQFLSMTQQEEELVNQWNKITRTECLNLIESMPTRIS
jgi:hypothetical protein